MDTETNKNCPVDSVINTEKECRLAATGMGFTYIENLTGRDYPAGCCVNSKAAYFNYMTNSSTTTPKYGWRGICGRGKLYIEVSNMLYIFSRHILNT